MSVQEGAVSLRQKVWCDVGIDWAAETHAVCVMDANGRITAQFMIGHADDPAGAHPDRETGGQDVGQHDRGLVAHPCRHRCRELSANGTRTYSAWVPSIR